MDKTTEYNLDLRLFEKQSGRSLDWAIFEQTTLGKLHSTIPFQSLASLLPAKRTNVGVKARFIYEGGIALQILKHYYKLSDEKLIEQLNHNWVMQYFCGIRLSLSEQIKDSEVVSRWRKFIGEHLSINLAQYALVKAWKKDMTQTKSNLSDATCYESYIRYPTDAKLLWESVDYLWRNLRQLARYLKVPMFRSKYRDVQKAYLNFSKKKRKTHKQRKAIKRRLLHLLNKLLGQAPLLIGIWKRNPILSDQKPIKANFFGRLKTIKQVYRQQNILFKNSAQRMPDRIVSLLKPYIHPIVRGKENKRVEFGMKAHEMQVDGINFLEFTSFQAFHEGNRLTSTIRLHRVFFGSCQHFGGDRIYANNRNRKYCTEQQIYTCFAPKGRKAKDEGQRAVLRKEIAKQRATQLEGSFGNKKNHYLLDKIKARTEPTEIAWIFFGSLTANAVAMVKKTKPPPN